MKTEKAVFGAGCFWHVEEEFRLLRGVVKTAVGFMGGKTKNPTYQDVCTDKTGHVEVCLVEYDSKIISFEQLLDTFWKVHDPTQYDKQGPDVGSQYKSAIFYYDDGQKKTALESIERQQIKLKSKIVTEVIPAKIFYPAEEYHQKYLMKMGKNSCRI
jgi:peptide-methionine (S)-S-oxide reductase